MGIQAMISSLKNNNRRQLRTPFDKESIYLSSSDQIKKTVFKKASKELLLKIRNKTLKNSQIYQQKMIGYTCLSILFICTILYFSNDIISFIF